VLIAQESTLVAASLDRVRDAVLDPDAYTKADTKVNTIVVEERTPGGMVARVHGQFGPIKSSILARYTVHDRRVDLDMLEGRLRGFHATFELEPAGGGVRLTHREEYDFGYPLVTPLVEMMLRGWVRRSIQAEVESLKRAAEEAPRSPVEPAG
jgi:ribosome-associated toxin RatA of RatAB toxin-antitoxin module